MHNEMEQSNKGIYRLNREDCKVPTKVDSFHVGVLVPVHDI